MLKVSLRDFQLKPSKYLDKLPILLTRYDKTMGVLKRASDKEVEDTDSENFLQKIEPILPRVAKEANLEQKRFMQGEKVKGRMTSYGVQLCQHGKPYKLFCPECGS